MPETRNYLLEADVEQIIQREREKFPDATPRIISDNGPQFIARDFKPTGAVSSIALWTKPTEMGGNPWVPAEAMADFFK